jgi:hypothetical protein
MPSRSHALTLSHRYTHNNDFAGAFATGLCPSRKHWKKGAVIAFYFLGAICFRDGSRKTFFNLYGVAF